MKVISIHNFISSSGSGTGSGSDFLTSYGSGSTSQKVTVPTVPVPQHCIWYRTWKKSVLYLLTYLLLVLASQLFKPNKVVDRLQKNNKKGYIMSTVYTKW
jgi:hypothetical protein